MVAASSICGHIGPQSPGSRTDRIFLEKMRDASGASLIGAGTLRQADPEIRGSAATLAPDRVRAVVSLSGNIPLAGKKLFAHAPAPVIFTSLENISALQAKMAERAEIIALSAGPCGLSLHEAIVSLKERTSGDILIEGGGRLNYAALKEGVVDEIHLTICPKISGHAGAPSLIVGPQSLGQSFGDLQLLDVKAEESGEIFARYLVK